MLENSIIQVNSVFLPIVPGSYVHNSNFYSSVVLFCVIEETCSIALVQIREQ